jgi:hypothetical protein
MNSLGVLFADRLDPPGQRRAWPRSGGWSWSGRDRGKSDSIDAEAVGSLGAAHPELPVASLDGAPGRSSCCRASVEDLVRQRTQV